MLEHFTDLGAVQQTLARTQSWMAQLHGCFDRELYNASTPPTTSLSSSEQVSISLPDDSCGIYLVEEARHLVAGTVPKPMWGIRFRESHPDTSPKQFPQHLTILASDQGFYDVRSVSMTYDRTRVPIHAAEFLSDGHHITRISQVTDPNILFFSQSDSGVQLIKMDFTFEADRLAAWTALVSSQYSDRETLLEERDATAIKLSSNGMWVAIGPDRNFNRFLAKLDIGQVINNIPFARSATNYG